MEEIHQYEVNLQWNHDRKGTLSSSDLPQQIEVVTPPDFYKGIPGFWSPEHLFVASVVSCFMTTFLGIAENSKLECTNLEIQASGVVDKVEGKFQVTEIILKPTATIPSNMSTEKATRVIEMAEKNCLIANSVKTIIHLQSKVVMAQIA
ncbi:OsmC family protein [Mucilaginibacter antarcticus]|uniref:OsmC family protein n=1 Tax=Mucilaginibacter antarcticus TaxID=1855725 RepID=A0ABW5XNA6_9SPHI